MRLLASTVLVDRYARQVLLPAPTACASDWQCASAPAKPPKLPPLPGFELVTKKLMFDAGACASAMPTLKAKTPIPPSTVRRFIGITIVKRKCENFQTVPNAVEQVNSARGKLRFVVCRASVRSSSIPRLAGSAETARNGT